MRIRTAALAAAAAIAAAALTGCTSADTTAKPDTPASSTPATDAKPAAPDHTGDVKITKKGREDHDLWGPNSYTVHYEITNHGDKAANYFVGLEFLDKDGDVLGSTGAGAQKLGPGKTNTGNAVPLDVEITNGKLSDIVDVRVDEVQRTDSM